jgi:hypothetical protein
MAFNAQFVPSDAYAITPSDTAGNTAAALWTGSGGSIAVVTEAGTTLTFGNVPAGSYLNQRVQKVLATGTTATGIIGLR